MPKTTDSSFTDKLHHLWSNKSTKYRRSRLSQGFILTHYAAEVEYSTEGWLEKNKDPLNDNITQLLAESTEANIRYLFAHEAIKQGPGGKLAKKGMFRTVAQRHKEQLNHLMTQLNSTHPHFVRCIIPNHQKTPHKFDNILVLDQLRCNGVLEGIRIARTGYPNRLFFSELRQRYEVLVSGMPKGYMEGQKACHLILKKLHLDDNLYKVGLTKVFFKSGVLAELEERREAMVRKLFTQFQSISRGYLQREKVRKSLFTAQATSIIKRNFEVYLGMRDNPWWKLYVKMRPLLIVSRESGRSKAQDMAIKKLEQTVKDVEVERDRVIGDQKNIESDLEKLSETLESERRLALDNAEFLKRSQERESDLEEQLLSALDDMDKLEIQCEELLIAKKRVDSQAEAWRNELENGAAIMGHLEMEKAKLRDRLISLESQLADTTSEKAAKLSEYVKISEEVSQLRQTLDERNEKIEELESELAKSDVKLQQMLSNFSSDLELSKIQVSKLTAENVEQREQLEELYKTSSDYEELVRKKEEELEILKDKLRNEQASFSEEQKGLRDLEKNYNAACVKLDAAEQDLSTFKIKCAFLEKEGKEARQLLEAKVSDDVKNRESRKMLDRKVNELLTQVAHQEEALSAERERCEIELASKQSYIDKLCAEKDKLSADLKESKDVFRENEKLSAELEKARQQTLHNTTVRSEILSLKKDLKECENSRSQGLACIEELRSRISDALSYSSKLKTDLETAAAEKKQLSNQIGQLKTFIDDDLAGREYMILEKNKIVQDLENTRQELSNVTFEYNKLSKELGKKGDHLKRMRTSFTDEAASNLTKLNQRRAESEANEKKLRQELEDSRLEIATLKKQKTKMSQEIDDLNHDISVEKKASNLAELQKESLEARLDEMQAPSEKDRREKIELEATNQRLTTQVESMKLSLAEKTAQLSHFQNLDKSTHLRNRSWDAGNEPDFKELARKLSDAERRLKLSEDSKALLKRQLDEACSGKGPLDLANGSPSRRSLLEMRPGSAPSSPGNKRALRATNGIKSTIDSLYNPEKSRLSYSSYRNKNSFDQDKENMELLSVIDSVKSLNISSKSIDEVEDLLTNYESSRRDMLSVFQENSKKLLDAKDALAAAELDISRLQKELSQRESRPDRLEPDMEGMNSALSELELRLDAEVSMNQDLAGSLRLYKSRAEDYYSKLESAETVVLKASRAEAFAKAQWKEVETSLATALKESKDQESKMISLQSKIQLLEDKLEDSSIDLSHSREAQKRVAREIQDLKDRRKQDSLDMESSLNTMRERYKGEIQAITEELEREKLKMGDLQTQNRHLQHDLDMQKVRNNFDSLDPSWSSFKAQLEDKVQELTKANEQAVLSYNDSQRRVGSLLSQVRTLRTTMEEITSNRDQLQEEKRILERRLNEVSEHLEELAQAPGLQSTFGSDVELHQLKSSVRQKTQDHSAALERLRAIEDAKFDVQKQLESERHRVEELNMERTLIDKKNKDLHLKVVDLEAQLLGVKNYDSKFLVQKVSQLEKQLEEQAKRHAGEWRNSRSTDRSVKELQTQILQKERMTSRLQEELVRNEAKVKSLQETVENLQTLESTHSLASRRSEREARDSRETALRLEKDLEEWKSRYHAVSSKRNSRVF